MTECELLEKLIKRKSLECVFCHHFLPNITSIVNHDYCLNGMSQSDILQYIEIQNTGDANENFIVLEYITCPQCQKTSITAYRPFSESCIPIYPQCKGKTYPEYIPKQIRQDYEEAC